MGARDDLAHFPAKVGEKIKIEKSIIAWIFSYQSMNNSLLGSQRQCDPNSQLAQKWPSYGQKTFAQIWASASFLAITWPNNT